MIERLRHALEHVDDLSPEMQEQLAEQIESFVRSAAQPASGGAPFVSLGERLAALRAQIVDSGEPLLSWDGVEAEVAERRGEHEPGASQ